MSTSTIEETTVSVQSFEVDADKLARSFANAALFTAGPERPVIAQIRCTVAGESLTVESTDSYVLYRERLDILPISSGELVFFVQKDQTLATVKAVKTQKRGKVLVTVDSVGPDRVRFSGSGWSTVGDEVDYAEFPRVDQLRKDERAEVGVIGFGGAILAKLGKVQSGRGKQRTGEAIRFEFSGPLKPSVVRFGDDIDLLVMPVRMA